MQKNKNNQKWAEEKRKSQLSKDTSKTSKKG